MWLSSGIRVPKWRSSGRSRPVPGIRSRQPTQLKGVRVWNYNENLVKDLSSRGAGKIRVTAGRVNQPEAFTNELAVLEVPKGSGKESGPEYFALAAKGVRFLRFDILSNQNGVSYPAQGEPDDNGFVGLAEVQFLGPDEQPIGGVSLAQASSELASHQRNGRNLLNGSGLGESRQGWNAQGLPFYSAGVAYAEKFVLEKKRGKYFVSVPNWYGSVAKVSVNGKPAGYIDAPPWELDATKWVRAGNNEVVVTVIGTPKNLLGPHHGNPVLGAAWPGNFQRGPNPGPPAGSQYSNVAYGLFEPFVLVQKTAARQ